VTARGGELGHQVGRRFGHRLAPDAWVGVARLLVAGLFVLAAVVSVLKILSLT